MSLAVVIGAGRMARLRLAELRQVDGIDELVVATRDPARAADLRELSVSVIGMEELAAVEPALTLVASATAHHAEDVAAALDLRAPVLCEKPLAESIASAEALARDAAERGIPLYVAFQRHFERGLGELRGRFEDGSLGVPYHMRFTHLDREPGTRGFIATSGGIYRDLLVHDIECALWLTGQRATRVYATGSVRKWRDYADCGDLDTATVLMTLDDGLTVTLHGTRHNPLGQDARVEVVGSKDSVSVGLTARTPLKALDAPELVNRLPWQGFEERFGPAFALETRTFAAFALGAADRFDGATAEAAVAALAVAEACDRSQREGRPVEV